MIRRVIECMWGYLAKTKSEPFFIEIGTPISTHSALSGTPMPSPLRSSKMIGVMGTCMEGGLG